jgi:hypothetical protein
VLGWLGARAVSGRSFDAWGGLGRELGQALPALVGSAAFTLGFVGLAFVFKSPELTTVLGPVLRRLRR